MAAVLFEELSNVMLFQNKALMLTFVSAETGSAV
jgi:hypothetical protein